jgi:predicted GIY-YIG superfamily endonuclease
MAINYRGLGFAARSIPPTSPGLYAAIDAFNNIYYVGEAQNVWNRIQDYRRGQHEGLDRAELFGAKSLVYSESVTPLRDRLDIETLIRREFDPSANYQSRPSLLAAAQAASRLGLSRLATQWYRLASPPLGVPRTVGRLPMRPPQPVNAFASLLLNSGRN